MLFHYLFQFLDHTYNTQQDDHNISERNNPGRQYSKPPQSKPSKSIDSQKRSADTKSFQPAETSEKRELDEYDLYCQLLAKKLRKLDEHQRDVTMHEIDNLMFRAKMQGSQRSYPSSPASPGRKVKSPLFIVAPPSHAHYEDENLPYQEHMQPPEPS